MSLDNFVRSVAGRLSLREPQFESLRKLAAMVEELKAQFPNDLANLADFERDFRSLCFAFATGVGKTRLMGAFSRP